MATSKRLLEGLIAIVTGSSSGNGRAIALAFAERGARVLCADIDPNPRSGGYEKQFGGEAVVPTDALIRSQGGQSVFHSTNVSDEVQVQKLVEAAANKFGRLDILVNNAGVLEQPTKIDQLELKDWDKVMAVNLTSVFLGCKYAIRQFLCQPASQEENRSCKGKIINIASVAAQRAAPLHPVYCASKAGVVGLTKQVAVDNAEHRINVNAVAPGLIPTAMTRDILQDVGTSQTLSERTPCPHLGVPQDVAEACVFLASGSSNWVTGSVLTVDGGYTAG